MKVAIIGAGIGGLAAAVRLAKQGHEVHVFEANKAAGGKLSEFEQQGFRFDGGPSLFTMPKYVEELFELAGEDAKLHFQYQKLEVVCQYFWSDQTQITAFSDKNRFAREVQQKLGVSGQILLDALGDSERKYELTGKIFLNKSLHKLKTWLSFDVLRAMLATPTLDIFKTMHQNHKKRVGHYKLVQLLNRFATYNGSNPYRASGMLSIIPHFEHGIGAFYPQKGMYEIADSIFELSKRLGVRFHFEEKVSEIVLNEAQNQVTGIKTKQNFQPFDRVVSNIDVYFTYKKLLPTISHPEKTLRQERSTSALIFYWGIKKSFSELHLHNIFFSDDYKTEFSELDAGNVCDQPTVYVNISSKFTPTDAPKDSENWFVMVNVPHHQAQDWEEIVARTRENVIQKVSNDLGMSVADFKALIACETLLTPPNIEEKTGSYGGALYGTSSNNLFAAFARHPNFSNEIKGLYFCGGSVHPGGGIPLALLSAKIVSENFE